MRIGGVTGIDGFDGYLCNSRSNLDILVPAFRKAINMGYDPNEVKDDIFREKGIAEEDLTELDKKELVRRVEKIWEEKLRGRNPWLD